MLPWPGADPTLSEVCLPCPGMPASSYLALCVLEPTHWFAQADAFFDTALPQLDRFTELLRAKFPRKVIWAL